MRRRALVVALLFIEAAPHGVVREARGYSGGPQLVEILGWSHALHRVYFHLVPLDESGSFGGIYYFGLHSQHPGIRVHAHWNDAPASYVDSLETSRLDSMRRRLRQLPVEPSTLFSDARTEIIKTDSLRAPTVYGDAQIVRRYTVRLTYFNPLTGFESQFDVLCYWRPKVSIKDVFRVPEEDARVFVIACYGDKHDSQIETQVPVLVTSDHSTSRVEWIPDR